MLTQQTQIQRATQSTMNIKADVTSIRPLNVYDVIPHTCTPVIIICTHLYMYYTHNIMGLFAYIQRHLPSHITNHHTDNSSFSHEPVPPKITLCIYPSPVLRDNCLHCHLLWKNFSLVEISCYIKQWTHFGVSTGLVVLAWRESLPEMCVLQEASLDSSAWGNGRVLIVKHAECNMCIRPYSAIMM